VRHLDVELDATSLAVVDEQLTADPRLRIPSGALA